jgi:4-amino-4-deoxy-L-arabinose transferase-like glycosyltransferase
MERMKSSVSAPVVVLLTIIIAAYAAIGTLYAALTPTWQVPDEPAHYNYVRSLAEGGGFPVLEARDYTQSYLERLTSERFPPELSIDPLEYEDHQPPLYYLLATPIYLLFAGALLPLRLFSVVLGAGLLIVAFETVRAIFPNRPALGLMTAAFIAFIPQHVAMSAGVNNDTLAELIVGATLWALVVYVDGGSMVRLGSPQARSTGPMVRLRSPQARSTGPMVRLHSPQAESAAEEQSAMPGRSEQRPWHVGLLLAAALLTKTTAYVVVGMAVAAVVIRWHSEGRTWRWVAGQLAWMLAPALLLSAPWFIRNGLTYGWSDPLGLARHETIVEGQPRSSEWLTIYGWRGLLTRMARTTFQSFWGQFGWMAVPLPPRMYQILLVLSVLLAAGFFVWLVRERGSESLSGRVYRATSLLALSALLTFMAFVWYNLSFVQHQGRYLFPALIPIGTAAALGLDTLARVLPKQLRSWAIGGLFVVLAAFDVYCLFRVVVPNLTR